MCSGSSGGGLPQGAKNFSGGPTMGIQPVQSSYGTNASGTYSQDGGMQTGTGLLTGGGEPMMGTQPVTATNGPRQPPITPPSAGGAQPYNPSQPISAQPGGNGWGPQTMDPNRNHGHNFVNPYPGMNGAQRNAAMTAENEQRMAENHAQRLAARQQHQASRGGNFESGGAGSSMPFGFQPGNSFEQNQAAFQNAQSQQAAYNQSKMTDPAVWQSLLLAGKMAPMSKEQGDWYAANGGSQGQAYGAGQSAINASLAGRWK